MIKTFIKQNKLKILNFNKLDFFFSNKITFIYLTVNLYLFNLMKNFFVHFSDINILTSKKSLINNIIPKYQKNIDLSIFSSRCMFVNSFDLELLFHFNTFFTSNSSLAILGVYYNNIYYSFGYFKNLVLMSKFYLTQTVSLLLFGSFLKLFCIFRKIILK